MKFKLLFALLCMFMCGTQGFSQVNDITWGPEYKTKGARQFIAQNKEYLYIYRFEKKKTFLERFDVADMSLNYSREISFKTELKGARNISLLETYFIEDKIIQFGNSYSKTEDRNVLFGKVFNAEGEVEEDWKEIVSQEAERSKNAGSFDIYKSSDSTQILVGVNLPYDKNSAERYNLILFNKKLEEVWNKQFVLPYKDSKTSIRRFAVDNSGTVFMLATVSAEKKEAKLLKKEKESTFKYILLSYHPKDEEPVEYEVSLSKKDISYLTFSFDKSENIILAGYYSDKTKKRAQLSGSFFIKIDKNTKEVLHTSTKDFDQEFVAQIIGEKGVRKGREIPLDFQLRELVIREDGGCVLVSEQYYMVQHCTTDPKTGAQNCYYTYHYNSIIVTNINPLGDVDWYSLIPKSSSDGSGGYYLSYALSVVGDKLYFIYNDNKKNYENGMRKEKLRGLGSLKKAYTVVTTIDGKGGVETEVLFEPKKNKIYPRPKMSQQLNANMTVMIAQNGKKYRLGKFEFGK